MKLSPQALKRALGRGSPWQSKPHKAVFWICGVCLSLYISYVTFLAHSSFLASGLDTLLCMLAFLGLAALVLLGLVWACRRLEDRGMAPCPEGSSVALCPEGSGVAPYPEGSGMAPCPEGTRRRVLCPKGRSLPFFLGSMGLTALILGIQLMACYPGGVSYDVYNQWTQAGTGLYNSWHPVFHTLLIGLGRFITGDRYAVIVALQIAALAAALAYLMDTLRRLGLPGLVLLALQGLIVASPIVSHSMMYLWKDNAMTLGAVMLCAQSIKMYASKGAWAKTPVNAVVLGLTLAYTTLVRHNAMFFTLPLILSLLLCYAPWRKSLALAAGAMAAAMLLVQGPLYGALDIIQPDNTLEEAVGIPMTVMLDTRLTKPEVLDTETAAFLKDLVDDTVFAAKYEESNYNSIKFEYPREKISKTPPEKLLRMTLETLARNPQGAFASFNNLTDLVWGVTDKHEGAEKLSNSKDIPEVVYLNSPLNQLGKSLQRLLEGAGDWLPIRWVFQNIGVQLLALLLVTLWAVYRSGPSALTLAVPTLLYDLGTMLLLCGNDARFFQFSMVISLPALLALLLKPSDGKLPELRPSEADLSQAAGTQQKL